jgi:hypothetical protein
MTPLAILAIEEEAMSLELSEKRRNVSRSVDPFDGFARERAKAFSSKSNNAADAESMRFQNLPRSAARLNGLFGIDLQQRISPEDWSFAHTCFMRRHVLAHAAAVIDQEYLDETKEGSHLLGRRVTVSTSDVERFAAIVERLGESLVASFEALP